MTPKKLMAAAANKRAVIGSHQLGCGHRPTPAAWVIGMPFVYVCNHLSQLKIYENKNNKKVNRHKV
jgi:hypothetical protein